MTAATVVDRAEGLGLELAAWLRAVVGGLVAEHSAVGVDVRWLRRQTNVHGHVPGSDLGRVIGQRGVTLEHVRQLARCVGARLGVRIAENAPEKACKPGSVPPVAFSQPPRGVPANLSQRCQRGL
jgi:predicted RNA-binding protein YlqC (UPF0109 family)